MLELVWTAAWISGETRRTAHSDRPKINPAKPFAYCHGLCYTSGSVALSYTPSDWAGCAGAGPNAHRPLFTCSDEPLNGTGPCPD